MKPIPVPPNARALNALLKKARRRNVLLESANGERYVLAAVDNWQGFDVGDDTDFSVEVRRTAKHKRLAQVMARRREADAGSARISLGQAKKELGLK